jgi:NAD-dependent deacetylase
MLAEHWADRGQAPPRCPRCGGYLRPSVVSFSEAWRTAQHCDVSVSIGASLAMRPADLPLCAKQAGAYVTEINFYPSAPNHMFDEQILGPAGPIVPQLIEDRAWRAWPVAGDVLT